jgi:hypothetical protein
VGGQSSAWRVRGAARKQGASMSGSSIRSLQSIEAYQVEQSQGDVPSALPLRAVELVGRLRKHEKVERLALGIWRGERRHVGERGEEDHDWPMELPALSERVGRIRWRDLGEQERYRRACARMS